MKKLVCLLLTLAFVLSLCACSSGKIKVQNRATDGDVTEEPTKFSTNVEDYVYPEIKYTLTYSGDFQITGEKGIKDQKCANRLPQLSMDSADAKTINDDIHSKYDTVFENLAKADDEYRNPRTDYVAYLNDDILSLAIETRTTDTPNSGFNVYNINVESGARLTTDDVIALSNVTADEAKSQVKEAIEKKFEDASEFAGGNSEYESAKKKSLSNENLSGITYYFDGERRMVAVYRYYWFAGAESYGQLTTLDAVKTRG